MLFAVLLGNARRFLVRGNRVVPKADAREDMRWHVLGVGRRRRDFRVTLRCLEAFLRERRIVVEMDEIVGDARVLGLALEDRFQSWLPMLPESNSASFENDPQRLHSVSVATARRKAYRWPHA